MKSAETTSAYYGNPRREMQAFVPQTARRVLDIGCGAGVFGGLLKEARSPENTPEIWGVEMDPTAAALAESRLDRVLCGDVFTVLSQLEGQRFDAVVGGDGDELRGIGRGGASLDCGKTRGGSSQLFGAQKAALAAVTWVINRDRVE